MKRLPSFLPQPSPYRTPLYSTLASNQASRLSFAASNPCEFESRLHPANRPVTYPSSFVGGFFFNPILFSLLHFSNIARTACRAFRPSAEEVIPRSPVCSMLSFFKELLRVLTFWKCFIVWCVGLFRGCLRVWRFEGFEIWWDENDGMDVLEKWRGIGSKNALRLRGQRRGRIGRMSCVCVRFGMTISNGMELIQWLGWWGKRHGSLPYQVDINEAVINGSW